MASTDVFLGYRRHGDQTVKLFKRYLIDKGLPAECGTPMRKCWATIVMISPH